MPHHSQYPTETTQTAPRKPKKPQQPGILMRSMPLDEDSLDSFAEDSDDEDSVELDVQIVEEDVDYETHVVLGKLSRNSNRTSIWQTKLDAYFVLAQFLVSLESVFAIALNLQKYGQDFLPVYITTVLVVGFPLVYLELALGQFTSCNTFTIFRRMAPAAAGIGIAALVANVLAMLSSFMRIVTYLQIFVEVINPFANSYPWTGCTSDDDSKYCTSSVLSCEDMIMARGDIKLPDEYGDLAQKMGLHYIRIGDTCVRSDIPAIQEQFKPPKNLFDYDPMVNHLFPNIDVEELTFRYYPSTTRVMLTIVAWLMILTIAHKSRSVLVTIARGSTLLVCAATPIMVAVLVEVRETRINLSALIGKSSSTGYANITMWMNAVLLTIRTLKLGEGCLPYLASQNEFRNNIFWDAAIIVLFGVTGPFTVAMIYLTIIDTYRLSVLSGSSEMHSKVGLGNNYMELLIMAVMETSMQVFKMYAPFMLLMQSSCIIVIIIANCLIRIDVVVTTITEMEASFNDRSTRGVLVNQVVVVTALCGMIFYTTNGLKLLIGFEVVTLPVLTCLIVLAELTVLCLCYGVRRFFANVSAMNRSKAHNQWLYQWLVIVMSFDWMVLAPGFIWIALFSCLVTSIAADNGETKFGFFILALLVFCIVPACFVEKWTDAVSKRRDWTLLFRPDPDLWGPRSALHREMNDRLEHKIKPVRINIGTIGQALKWLKRKMGS